MKESETQNSSGPAGCAPASGSADVAQKLDEYWQQMPKWMKYGYQNNAGVNRTIHECAYGGKTYVEMADYVGESLIKQTEHLHQELCRAIMKNPPNDQAE
jgi:hypothetical protein